ncbi:hypothetical protein CHUAL_007124 [Chamberlinius hualienensis]
MKCGVVLLSCLLIASTSGGRIRRQALPPCQTDSGAAGTCGPLTACPTLSSDIQVLARNICPLDDTGANGVCCPNVPIPAGPAPVNPVQITIFTGPGETLSFRQEELGVSSGNAEAELQRREQLEQTLVTQGLTVKPNTAEDVHNQIQFADSEAQRLGKQGLVTSETSRDLTERLNLNPSVVSASLPTVSIATSSIADACPKEPVCPATKYRSFDGSCNNLENKDWGKASRAFQRMSQSTYLDGVSKPRKAVDNGELPSCRLISTTIIQSQNAEYPDINHLFMGFGQFVDHDLSLTPTTRGANGSGILCCPPQISAELRHPECMEISIPSNDPFYQQFNQQCMEFVRTIPAPPPKCSLGPREQLNQLTNFVDSSMIYGSSENQTKNLRDTNGGRLKVGGGAAGREFPPHRNGGGCTGDVGRGMFCFQAGDVRSTEQPLLGVLHTAFLREHNRIAAELVRLNPGWNDETLFQEARRIIQAEMQHITYNEFLPLVLGNRMMKRFDLELQKDGFFNKYDATLDPTIFNEFATAAYRFGHSLVQSQMQLIGGGNAQNQQLRNHFLKPFENSLLDNYIRGAATQPSQVVDENVTPELTNHLFQRNNQFGLDLAAINCQRGRDHAIGTYTQLRKVCGLPPVTSFADLASHMKPDVASKFAQVYKNVEDIDLWVAGVSEKPMPGAAVGPTFGCIIAEQFRRLRLGDRLWYERGSTESSLSEAQISEIRQTSLARILCDNTDVKEMQPLALLKDTQWNAKVSCDSTTIPKPSLRPWRNEPVWTK